MPQPSSLSPKTGSCHCGQVTFTAILPDEILVQECNCSLCERLGFLHIIIPASRFEIKSGKDHLTLYQFNTKTAQHYFCRTCGVKAFYVPRSNPDGYSLNLRTMDRNQFKKITIEPFDGQNWEDHATSLKHLSEE